MSIRIGINGFGRIGRLVFREMMRRGGYEVVLINDITDARTLAHLLKYDSTHGRYPGKVETGDNCIIVDGRTIKVSAEKNPANLPWRDLDVYFVVESTGVFSKREQCQMHLDAGAKKVILTVPAKGEIDATIVMGVNEHMLKAEHLVVSNASCTTNCLAPMAKVLSDSFGIVHGMMNTIHAYTNDQRVLDLPHSDLRRARSAALNSIPTSTGAAKAIGLVIPELKGKMDGLAIRVPVPDGSIVDLTCTLERDASKDAINEAMKAAADGPMKGILEFTADDVVSSDIVGNRHSCVFDSKLTMAISPRMVKVIGWYDNEYGYSCRVVDLIAKAVALK
ncbi:MAG: type I glyceraldehyde-3-phosphate dehydrogenase [Calditrichaeota bacterium]|nr:type I glyceraldehyde-3-phosphate dehydrogenase [Calditrichota bacterium]